MLLLIALIKYGSIRCGFDVSYFSSYFYLFTNFFRKYFNFHHNEFLIYGRMIECVFNYLLHLDHSAIYNKQKSNISMLLLQAFVMSLLFI